MLDFLSPYTMLIKIGALIALALALAWCWHLFVDHYREQGRVEIRKEWDADKAARIKRTTELTLLLSGKLQVAMGEADKAKEKRNVAFDGIANAGRSVAVGRGIVIPADVGRVLDDASRAANSARSDARAEARADPVPAIPQAQAYDEREIAGFGVEAGRAYADAYGLWKACRVREDVQLAVSILGANP